MVAEALDISRETYLAILMDRACNGPVLVGSPQGGVDIEEVAEKTPELIFKVSFLLIVPAYPLPPKKKPTVTLGKSVCCFYWPSIQLINHSN